MHQDTFKTKASNEAYRKGWDNIFGKKNKDTKEFEDVDQETLDAELEAEENGS